MQTRKLEFKENKIYVKFRGLKKAESKRKGGDKNGSRKSNCIFKLGRSN